MRLLKEILRVVRAKTSKSNLLALISDDNEYSTLTSRFLSGLVEEEYQTDDDASRSLYNSGARDTRYRTLKSRAYDKLTLSILNLNIKPPDHSEYLSSYYKCIRYEVAAQTLMRFASRKAGYMVALRTLSIAQKYHFSSVCLSLSALIRDSAALWGDQTTFYQYNLKVRYYSRSVVFELESDFLLDDLRLELSVTHYDRKYYQNKHKSVLDTISSMVDSCPSHLLILNRYRASIIYYETLEEFDEVKEQCESAIHYLKGLPHLTQKARLGEFLLRRVAADIYTRNPVSISFINECMALFSVGGPNWNTGMILSFVSSMYSLDFSQANEVHKSVFNANNFDQMHGLAKERWLLHNAYLLLAKQIGLSDLKDMSIDGFRISTFLNSMTNESKSKRGANSLIIVFHALSLLLNKNLILPKNELNILTSIARDTYEIGNTPEYGFLSRQFSRYLG
ncbi:MAG: hypothetical protein IPI29_02845 [Ignavibacteria bacterium]|nr:hypothetical protein [Ignavibacteria bacterium]